MTGSLFVASIRRLQIALPGRTNAKSDLCYPVIGDHCGVKKLNPWLIAHL